MTVSVDDKQCEIDFQHVPDTRLYSLLLNGKSYDLDIDHDEDTFNVMLDGIRYEVEVQDERTRRLATLRGSIGGSIGEILIKAPMPGVVVEVPVKVGQQVSQDETVIILESMKMQNEFKSPKDGLVSSVRVSEGDAIDQKTIMVTIS